MEVVEAGAEETSGEEDEEAVEETSGAVGEGVGEGGTSGGEEGAAGEVAAGALAEHKRMLAFATFRASTSEHFREFVLCASKPKSCSLRSRLWCNSRRYHVDMAQRTCVSHRAVCR